jgi:hypothetical protein
MLEAAFRNSNSVVNLAMLLNQQTVGDRIPNYSAAPILKGTKYEGDSRFAGMNNDRDTYAEIAKLEGEDHDREMLDQAGVAGKVLQFGLGLADPLIALPGGMGVKLVRGAAEAAIAGKVGSRVFVRSALESAAIGGLGVGAQEGVLQLNQDTRTPEESALNVGSATLLSAILGGGAASLLSAGRRQILADDISKLRREMDAHAGNAPPPTGEVAAPPLAPEAVPPGAEPAPGKAAIAAAVGAAATDVRKLELVPATPQIVRTAAQGAVDLIRQVPFVGPRTAKILEGMAALPDKTNPMSRIFASGIDTAKRAVVDLAETPLRFVANLAGETTVLGGGPPLERLAKMITMQTRVDVGDKLTELWDQYRFAPGEKPYFAKTRDTLNLLNRPDDKLPFEGFKDLVGIAMRNDDSHEIPQVQEAARYIRQRVYDPWLKRAQDNNMLPKDMDVKTAKSYINRIYDKELIKRDRNKFTDTTFNWLKGDQTVKYAAQQRLVASNDRLETANEQLNKINARIDTSKASQAKLEAALEERGKEARRTEQRTNLLDERSEDIRQEMQETRDDIDALRRQARDPAMLARIDQMQKDESELRGQDRPMTEAQLRALEDEERKSVLTGVNRKAAEMLVGRRKYPEAPSSGFLTWLTLNGGLKDEGGEVSGVLGGPNVKPGLINPQGRAFDQMGEKIQNEYPKQFPTTEVTGHGAPNRDDILNWISDATRGKEPSWWLEGLSPRERDLHEAGKLAATMDEALTRAGVKVNKIRDVADIFRDESKLPVNLRDLDKIAEDMEAAGQSVPVAIRHRAAADELRVAREDVARMRQLIAQAQAGNAARANRLATTDIKAGEAALAERANRGRLGILEDRLDRHEARRTLMEDVRQAWQDQHDEIRQGIEEELGRWQGRSASDAKSALKARAKYEEERDRGEVTTERLTSADDAVDSTVKKIIKSNRDLPDMELRSRADEIVQRVLGSPDGRLPYEMATGGPAAKVGYGNREIDLSEPARGSLAKRVFNIPDELIQPWLVNDVEHLVNAHMHTVVPDVLLTERFGDVGMQNEFRKVEDEFAGKIAASDDADERLKLGNQRETVLRDLAAVRDRIRGLYGAEAYKNMPNAARIASALKNYNVLASMGVATMSSLPDMAGVVFRFGLQAALGDAYTPFISSLMRGSGELPGEAFRQLKAMGVAVEMVTSARAHSMADVMDQMRPKSRFERTLQWGADKFQFANGLSPWTDMMKTIAGTVAMQELAIMSEAHAAGTASARELAILGENNITQQMAGRIAKQYRDSQQVIDGVALPNTRDWTDQAAREAFEGAVNREADIAVVTPGQERPLIMSNPVLSPLVQFKSFVAGSHQRILLANLQRHDAQVLQGVVSSLGLGMLSYKLNALTGGQPTSDNPGDWIKEAMSRGNLLGWFEDGNALAAKMSRGQVDVYRALGTQKPLSRYAGRNVMDQLLGPTAGKVENLQRITGAAFSGDWNEGDTKAVQRLQILGNLVYLRGLFNEVADGANNAFGIPVTSRPQ